MMETLVKERNGILDHEKLDAYHIAIEFVILLDEQRYTKGREL